MRISPVLSICLLQTIVSSQFSAQAAAISTGNLVVYRVGDGGAALTTAAAAVFLDEYTPTGTLVQSIAVPNTGATAMTAVGNSGTEGIITRSQDGSSLIFTGYRKDVGGTNPATDAPATTNRVIATLNLTGSLTTTTGLVDPTGNIRSATSVDGSSSFYIATSAAVRYVGSPSGSATSVSIDARNSREVVLSGGILYASNGSTAVTGKVQTYGTLPTTTTVPTPLAILGTADAVNGFSLFDLNPAVPGDDTLYALSTVANTILKYSFDGSVWTANGSIPASATANITGVVDGSSVNLYLTTGSTIFAMTDSSGYNSAITGTLTSIATAGTNTGFRGIGVLIPEPSVAMLGLGGLLLLMRRRK